MQTHAMAARLSKFKVGDLALKSALQLERVRAGVSDDKSQLLALAEALRVSAGDCDDPGKAARMSPGYFEPFERVYRSSLASEPKSSADILRFVDDAIHQIDAAAAGKISGSALAKLVDLCLELNREFVRRPVAEAKVGRSQRSVPIEAFVR